MRCVAVGILVAIVSFFGAWAFLSRQISDQQAQIIALHDELMAAHASSAVSASIPTWR